MGELLAHHRKHEFGDAVGGFQAKPLHLVANVGVSEASEQRVLIAVQVDAGHGLQGWCAFFVHVAADEGGKRRILGGFVHQTVTEQVAEVAQCLVPGVEKSQVHQLVRLTSPTIWTPACSYGGRPAGKWSSRTHCSNGSHTTGQPSVMPKASLRWTMSRPEHWISPSDNCLLFLELRKLVDESLRGGVEVAVAAVERVVDFPSPRIGRDGLSGPCPVGFWWDESDADGSHQGIAVASSDRLFWHLLLSAGDIADDLGPEPALGAAPDSDEPVDRGAVAVEELEDLSNAKSNAFIDRTEQGDRAGVAASTQR
jgi:hypothetical protein